MWYLLEWQMLCYVVDIVTTFVIVAFWADVIAKVADVIATVLIVYVLAVGVAKVADGMPAMGVDWQMLWPRWQME